MRWQQGRRSENVEDRRGMRIGGPATLVGGGGIVVVILALLLGLDPRQLFESDASGASRVATSPAEDRLADFASAVLASTEDTWGEIFRASGKGTYREPTLVLFRGAVQSACGFAQAAMGPFYCPADQKLYLDLAFFDELARLGGSGDFAQAYVIAHEVGHHVQNLLGISDRVQRMRSHVGEQEGNELSVRLELQADFFAGVWAHHAERARAILERGDVEEAISAASAVGDDRLQRRARGYVVPDSFTHGTSAQRARWFRLGLETGDLQQGDTFSAKRL